jgi:hypothetical protein
MNKTIIAAGSGPCYSQWPHWPVWTKLFPMMYKANLVDASGPAAGNKFLYRSVLTRLQHCDPELVLMQWNLNKYDVYVENPEFIRQIIHGKSIRNFIVDIHSGKTVTNEGYWCSSNDDTVEWKREYNRLVKSSRGTALDDLDHMISLQNLCAKKNIPYKFFCHNDINHEYFSTDVHIQPLYNEIDWEAQIFPSVRRMYTNHESFAYSTEGKVPEFHSVPNADWQYWFASNQLKPLMDVLGIESKNNWSQISEYCHKKTLESYGKISY